ncbi:MAG: DUF418 domain-containing protein [Pseudomonadales bacterium]|jgi:uncharacterized protein|nr:DUF418 domain-containing protein [Pseudomonadales bacterium]MDP6472482.1 DUF418 domain-containing protein [Pseudomonadales bacterium]MDP6828707.1 DUF418 domain-containing protein [Pseudomonadales bacterium]MDP6973312.1 DUF418 domain-containing protein [Pseudomonadales bacterium]|tara:strand:+ start:888 stop:2156 length:1269 start_codon:yes stop_codon:yes gene_type:complete
MSELATGPVTETARIQSLDVLRGLALLGILLLNILGFGLQSSGYFDPTIGSGGNPTLNLGVWAFVDILFEGAMRCLFSILFGAGVVLFATGAREGRGILHYKRQFWLFVFGLFNAYVLLWVGDILTVYALAGACLYLCRNGSAKRLLSAGIVLVVLISLLNVAQGFGLGLAREAAEAIAAGERVSPETEQAADVWYEFEANYTGADEELVARRTSFVTAVAWTAEYMTEYFSYTIPVILFWDALAMMLIGMALYKYGILNAELSVRQYTRLTLAGFAVGLGLNVFEAHKAFASDFDMLVSFPYFQITYHLGRLGMAFGYLGLVMIACKLMLLPGLRARLSTVGRMALTNYLMHSAIALFLFTGAGLALVGEMERWALYLIVFAIWLLQLILSPWWLERYRFGPAEWLWRALTYGNRPAMRRD